MNQKHILALLLVLAMVLCGCGAPEETVPTTTEPPMPTTPEEIWAAVQEAVAAAPCTKAGMAMDLGIHMTAPDVEPIIMNMTLESTISMSYDPIASLADMTMRMSFMGQDTETVSTVYTFVEDGAVVVYSHEGNVWTKLDSLQKAEDLLQTIPMPETMMDLDETVTQWNGKPAICLTSQVSGKDISGIMDTVMQSVSGENGEEAAALEAMTCDTRTYVDPVTYLPMAQEITIHGMTEAFADMAGDSGLSVEVPDCTVTITYLSYEPQAPIALPEGAVEKAESYARLVAGNPDNGDGTYTIRQGSVLVDIALPEGFEVTETRTDRVKATLPDSTRTLIFTVYYVAEDPELSGETFLDSRDLWQSRYEEADARVEREPAELSTDSFTFAADLMTTTWVGGFVDSEYVAWAPLAQEGSAAYYIHVEVDAGYNGIDGTTINSDLTLEDFQSYLTAVIPNHLFDE